MEQRTLTKERRTYGAPVPTREHLVGKVLRQRPARPGEHRRRQRGRPGPAAAGQAASETARGPRGRGAADAAPRGSRSVRRGSRDLRMHYETTGSRDLDEAAKRFKHLDRFFLGRRLASIGGAYAGAYVAHRQKDEAANGTINRELAVLTKMLQTRLRERKAAPAPRDPKAQGGVTAQRLSRGCTIRGGVSTPPGRPSRGGGARLRVRVACPGGARDRAQTRGPDRGTLALDPGSTKNDEGAHRVHAPGREGGGRGAARQG